MNNLTWEDVEQQVKAIAERHADKQYTGVYGIPQGGAPIAILVSNLLDLTILDEPEAGCLVVDDLIDSGATAQRVLAKHSQVTFDAAYRKPWSPKDIAPEAEIKTDWVNFPWERDSGEPQDAIVRLLQHIGEDPTREGLLDTPKRVLKAFKEMTDGYNADIQSILGTTFDVGDVDEMIVVTGIDFVSLCEHHMLPFTGTATVAYIPNGRVVGLSKIPRIVEAFSHRLQVQERLTRQITTALDEHLGTQGSACLITSGHACMGHRGVKKPNAKMTTSSLTGIFKADSETRNEFLMLAKG